MRRSPTGAPSIAAPCRAGRSPAGQASRRAPKPSRGSSPRASRSTASTPASASSPASGSPPSDLATLQRNIVLSHAAGVGEPMPAAVVRLMMALKLASLAQGASGVRLADARAARSDAGQRRHPGGAGARLGRRVGRSGAAGAHDGGDDRRRRMLYAARPLSRAKVALSRHGLEPVDARRRRKGWRC